MEPPTHRALPVGGQPGSMRYPRPISINDFLHLVLKGCLTRLRNVYPGKV